MALPRSRWPLPLFAPALALSFLLILPVVVRGAEPELETFLDSVREDASECTEYDSDHWLCVIRQGDVYATTDLIGSEGGLYVRPSATSFDAGARFSLDDELFAHWSKLVALALGADSEAQTWLADMNDGPKPEGTFDAAGWKLAWWSIAGDESASVGLDMTYWPDRAATAAPAPSFTLPSVAPVTAPDSSLGQWTYDGTWTLTAQLNDAGLPADPPLGTSWPATLSVDCDVPDEPCFVSLQLDEVPFWSGDAEPVEAGRLTASREREPDDCPGREIETETFDIEHGTDRAVAVLRTESDPSSCAVGGGMHYSIDSTYTFSGALVDFVPAVETPGTDGPQPSADAVPAEPDGAGGARGGERSFADAVPSATEVSTDPIVLLQSAVLAALLVFLMPFPSQLFNSTLETHEDEVRRWFRLDRLGAVAGGVGAFWASWPGVVIFTVLAALLYGFLDPAFGLDFGSLGTFVGMLLGIVLVTIAFAVPAVLAHRRVRSGWALKVVPISLLVGVGCVLLSRITGFQPGYLYGLLIGLAFARELSTADEGRVTAVGAVAMLALAFVSWLALGALPDGEAFGLVVARTTLAALMVAGLEGVVFGLLPMRFLPGEPLYAWNRAVWAALLAIGAFAFFHILINPASGYLSDTSRTPLFTVLGLLVVFSLVSVAFWAWFRFRPVPVEATVDARD